MAEAEPTYPAGIDLGTPIYDQLMREQRAANAALVPPLTLRERLGFKPSAATLQARVAHFQAQETATLNPVMLYDLARQQDQADEIDASEVRA